MDAMTLLILFEKLAPKLESAARLAIASGRSGADVFRLVHEKLEARGHLQLVM